MVLDDLISCLLYSFALDSVEELYDLISGRSRDNQFPHEHGHGIPLINT